MTIKELLCLNWLCLRRLLLKSLSPSLAGSMRRTCLRSTGATLLTKPTANATTIAIYSLNLAFLSITIRLRYNILRMLSFPTEEKMKICQNWSSYFFRVICGSISIIRSRIILWLILVVVSVVVPETSIYVSWRVVMSATSIHSKPKILDKCHAKWQENYPLSEPRPACPPLLTWCELLPRPLLLLYPCAHPVGWYPPSQPQLGL